MWRPLAFQIGEEVAMATTSAHDRYPGSAGYAAGPDTLGAALARNWWLIALRGVLGVVFGLIALLMPVATILALVLLFSAYMLVDGAFAIYAAIRAGQQGDSWGLLAFQGITSLVAGVLAFLWPGITVLAFVLLIAAWSIVTGCVMLAAALATEQARWWLVVGGAAAMLFGILMIVAPLAGAVVLTWWLGAYALVFGVALIILAFKLRSRYLAGYQDRGTAASARPAA
jgi:uncharacterized membrane protein HdeD (DUF308 family)